VAHREAEAQTRASADTFTLYSAATARSWARYGAAAVSNVNVDAEYCCGIEMLSEDTSDERLETMRGERRGSTLRESRHLGRSRLAAARRRRPTRAEPNAEQQPPPSLPGSVFLVLPASPSRLSVCPKSPERERELLPSSPSRRGRLRPR